MPFIHLAKFRFLKSFKKYIFDTKVFCQKPLREQKSYFGIKYFAFAVKCVWFFALRFLCIFVIFFSYSKYLFLNENVNTKLNMFSKLLRSAHLTYQPSSEKHHINRKHHNLFNKRAGNRLLFSSFLFPKIKAGNRLLFSSFLFPKINQSK